MLKINGFEVPRVLVPAQAERLAITRGQIRTELRRGNWQRLASGVVLTRPDEPTRVDWAEVGVALAGPGAAVSGWDALRVRGLGDRAAPSDHVIVLSRHGMNRTVGGVRLRRTTRPFARTIVSAQSPTMPLTPIVSVARAVADAALEYQDAARVRALVTSAIQRRACRVQDLLVELQAGPSNGSHLLRLALADAADGARSVAEATASGKLARTAVPAFELNVPVVDGHARVIYVVDVLWRELRAVLEIDSREFHLSETHWKATMARHNALTRGGLAVAHYPPSAVARRGWGAEVIAWLHARADELGVTDRVGRGAIAPSLGAAPPPLAVQGLEPRP
ncbi:MAG: hypothetical protein ABI429_05670 [Jatrophihabitantaceae bacterium]